MCGHGNVLRSARLVEGGVLPSAAAAIAREEAGPARRHADRSRGAPGAATPRDLASAAERLDAESLRHTLDDAFAAAGVESVWEQLCVPALTSLGRAVSPPGRGIGAVLSLSWAITTALHRAVASSPDPSRPERVLLACADGEQHSLALEALHAALTARGADSRMLGPSVPTAVVAAAARSARPAAIVVWSQSARTARVGTLRELHDPAWRPVAAGPGWDGRRLPAGVHRVVSLREAADLLVP
ncbi:MAG TPA: hypothetical protein VD813_12855 [Pseudonocardia sp.]|nr:hypothetical protein [Pseudonocardia sp.]